MSVSLKSRTEGAIWGVCVADALGGPVQFKDPKTFEPITGLRFVAPFKQPAGSYSDDGSMTLALAYSITESEMKYNHTLSIKFYVEWMTSGRFGTINRAWDMGRSTRKSLSIWKKSHMENIEGVQARIDIELDGEERSGNGSLMRIVPVGVAYWKDVVLAREIARVQGRVTHPSLPCVEACEAYTELVCGVMNGHTKQQLFDTISVFPFTHPALKERVAQYKTLNDWTSKSARHITSSGWIVDTLEVALWAFFKFDSWKKGALAVVNRGGDSDTAGAVYGGLAGAFYGVESIPQEWKDGMERKNFIGGIAHKLACGVVDGSLK
ncbi:hypothetical protein PENANT_c012G07778 [Penicillium antarcticum]|uniref:ADP-ribosylhydrolase ARH3 n=1 Tax=Penicillium antarcticum TaxID=416450 RepID=A0A1V6Q679_9EURO|nr:uncharacterized protein N7508_007977 [Penicillium antarcticum]KAJ5297728.1 hypothetical protein N7508_007977 [Penicillium antarcticum]OQD84734.1 hypothetical protein PENANT_c012G07778 [Penicillium antarcticum]